MLTIIKNRIFFYHGFPVRTEDLKHFLKVESLWNFTKDV